MADLGSLDPRPDDRLDSPLPATVQAYARLAGRFGASQQRPSDAESASVAVACLVLIGQVVDNAVFRDEVVSACAARGRAAPPVPDVADLAAALRLLALARRQVEQLGRDLIGTARLGQLRWRDIADGLGLESPQAAQQRYRRFAASRRLR